MEGMQTQHEIDVASFHTGNPQRDARVRSARFLNAREYPLMTFAALRADLTGLAGRYLDLVLEIRCTR